MIILINYYVVEVSLRFKSSSGVLGILEMVVSNACHESAKINSIKVSNWEIDEVVRHLSSRESDATHAASKGCVEVLSVSVVANSGLEVVDVGVESVVVGGSADAGKGGGHAVSNVEVVDVFKEREASVLGDKIWPSVILEKLANHVSSAIF